MYEHIGMTNQIVQGSKLGLYIVQIVSLQILGHQSLKLMETENVINTYHYWPPYNVHQQAPGPSFPSESVQILLFDKAA